MNLRTSLIPILTLLVCLNVSLPAAAKPSSSQHQLVIHSAVVVDDALYVRGENFDSRFTYVINLLI